MREQPRGFPQPLSGKLIRCEPLGRLSSLKHVLSIVTRRRREMSVGRHHRQSKPQRHARDQAAKAQHAVSPHDWGSAMGENGPVNSSLFAPAELGNDRGVADQPAISFAHHCAPDGRPIANIDVDPPKSVRSIGERRHVWQIEETSVLCRHAISNGWRSNRMLDWDRRERGSVDHYRFFQRQLAPIANGKAMDQSPCLPARVDGTGSACSKPSSMVRMGMQCVSTTAVGVTRPNRPSQSAPQSTMIRAVSH